MVPFEMQTGLHTMQDGAARSGTSLTRARSHLQLGVQRRADQLPRRSCFHRSFERCILFPGPFMAVLVRDLMPMPPEMLVQAVSVRGAESKVDALHG
jgi:hypothetical protein